MADLYRATDSFTTTRSGGHPVTVTAGEILWDDDELVQRFPQFFEISQAHQRPDVEEATSRPGEKRGAQK